MKKGERTGPNKMSTFRVALVSLAVSISTTTLYYPSYGHGDRE